MPSRTLGTLAVTFSVVHPVTAATTTLERYFAQAAAARGSPGAVRGPNSHRPPRTWPGTWTAHRQSASGCRPCPRPRTMPACGGTGDDKSCDWSEKQDALAANRWYATNQILPEGRA